MRLSFALLAALLLSACGFNQPAPLPPADPNATPRIGVVGLVQQSRTRGFTGDNWMDALAGVVRNSDKDDQANVVAVRYEVTVFYDAGQQEVITVEERPDVKPGQRVRVTGRKIEPLPAR